jgi:hypothetical protein
VAIGLKTRIQSLILLTFAHRGEAQSFLKEIPFQGVDFAFDGLFRHQNQWLLITGEGLQNTSEKVAAVLGAHSEITDVWNFGVAGGLNTNLTKGQILPIRTCYAEQKGEMVFKSFSSHFEDATTDLISCQERKLEKNQIDYLEGFASLVDREAWAIGSVCQLFKKKFYPLKLISDFPSSDQDICQVVKDQASEMSDQLYRAWLDHQGPSAKEWIDYEIPPDFYLTVGQERILRRLLDQLTLDGTPLSDIWSQINLTEIQSQKVRPKERSKELIKRIQAFLNPFTHEIQKDLLEVTLPLSSNGFKVSWPNDLEKEVLHLQFELNHPAQINKALTGLEDFNYDRWLMILRGQRSD